VLPASLAFETVKSTNDVMTPAASHDLRSLVAMLSLIMSYLRVSTSYLRFSTSCTQAFLLVNGWWQQGFQNVTEGDQVDI
jgi:hypothetical protein